MAKTKRPSWTKAAAALCPRWMPVTWRLCETPHFCEVRLTSARLSCTEICAAELIHAPEKIHRRLAPKLGFDLHRTLIRPRSEERRLQIRSGRSSSWKRTEAQGSDPPRFPFRADGRGAAGSTP